MSGTLTFIFAFVVVLGLIGLAAWLVRRFAGNRLGANTQRGRMPRLAVIDAAAVDGRRRLVLVRRDNIEHLLMIGGPTDIVVESNIVRATPSREALPQRLADRLIALARPSSWTNHAIQELEEKLHRWPIHPAGTEGYEKAEVTAGGVDTSEISSTTMECKRVPGLFFIGEIVDVTGHLGGFNFQWAWASGAAAGRAL